MGMTTFYTCPSGRTLCERGMGFNVWPEGEMVKTGHWKLSVDESAVQKFWIGGTVGHYIEDNRTVEFLEEVDLGEEEDEHIDY